MQIKVNMGVVSVTEPSNSLVTTVGSCVAVCLYDNRKKVGGMAHIVHAKRGEFVKANNPAKFADTAIPILISKLAEKGVSSLGMKAKISGGANMFPSIDQNILRIGEDNIEAVRKCLKKYSIPIISEDVGGEIGRRLEFRVGPNKLVIKKLSGETRII